MIDLRRHWQNVHVTGNTYWLTGSNPEYVYDVHHLSDLLKNKDLNITEIGIGKGDSIKYLAAFNNVIAIDIVPDAFEKIANCSRTILINDFNIVESNSQDLILCHLVIQHCSKDMVRHLINNSIRCLKKQGIFSFQFAYLPNDCNMIEDHKKYIEDGLLYFYSLHEIIQIVKEFNGKIDDVFGPIIHKLESNIHWYIVHCKIEM